MSFSAFILILLIELINYKGHIYFLTSEWDIYKKSSNFKHLFEKKF